LGFNLGLSERASCGNARKETQCEFAWSSCGFLSRVNHQTSIAGPKQIATPIGMVQKLQNLSIAVSQEHQPAVKKSKALISGRNFRRT